MLLSAMTAVHAVVVLLFGVLLAVAFTGLPFTRQNVFASFLLCLFSLLMQAVFLFVFNEAAVWKLYPLITHLPLVLMLVFLFKKPLITVLVAVFTSYLCCQPAKWVGVSVYTLTESSVLENAARVCTLIVVFALTKVFFARALSRFFCEGTKTLYVFAVVPIFYYIFDYTTVVYTDIHKTNNQIAIEFLPFFISVTFVIFCFAYYKLYEDKFEAERKEEIIRMSLEQQTKELEAFKRSERELRVLRHDLRLFLSTLAVCIETDEKSVVQGMIHSYSEHVDGTKIKRFCTNDTVNYVLSDFEGKCESKDTRFVCTVELGEIHTNEILFSSILSNALDNALQAVAELPREKRTVNLMLRNTDGKLLFSVKNPIEKAPVFVNGMPVTSRKGSGHGYGTKSILYMTEKLGGNCQFTVKDSTFVTRVIV